MQAYRGMDIGTAKPSADLKERLPHRLIDIRDPDEQYTAGDFVRLADAECASLLQAGSLPLVSGGTGFYLRNFICGPASAPPSSPEIRAQVALDLERRGLESLRAELAACDPASAIRIHGNDVYRLTRALEILRASGKAPSVFAPRTEARTDWDFLVVGVERPREELKARIASRVAAMMEAGLAEEFAELKAAGYGPEAPGLKAIGYREFFEMEGRPLGEIAKAIELHTVQYAKRQMTFLRALPGIVWIGPDAERLGSLVEGFLSGSAFRYTPPQ
jgi:tRNA dimethylallyltransferase